MPAPIAPQSFREGNNSERSRIQPHRHAPRVGWWSAIAAGALAACVTLAVFWPATRGGFVWDDGGLITKRHDTLDEWSDAVAAFGRAATAGEGVQYYRPIMIATFVADARLTNGFEASAFHRTNVFLHGVNVLLIALLLATLGCGPWASGIGAALFGLHPLQIQAVALIFGRNDLLLIPPIVGMLLADEVVRRRGTPRLADALVLLCFALTLWTKETGIVAPAFLIALDLLWHRRPLAGLRARLPLFIGFGVVAALYFAARLAVIGAMIDAGSYGYTAPLARIPVAIAIVGYYVRHVVVPFGMAPAPYHPGLVDPTAPELWIATAFVLGLVVTTGVTLRRQPRVATGLLVFAVALLPVTSLVAPMKVLILDHRTYLPMLGIAIAAAAVERWSATVAGRAVAVTVLVVLAGTTTVRLPFYADSLSLWALAVEAEPESDYARNNYAATLMDADRYLEAITQLREALRLNPDYDRARFNLAGCLDYTRQTHEALREWEILAERRPNDAGIQNSLGTIRGRLGDQVGAAAAFERAAAARPDDRNTIRNLADALDRHGAVDRAVPWRRRLTELDPQNAAAWIALARSLLTANQGPEAASAYERALQIGPDSGQLRVELGRALFQAGRWPEAAAQAKHGRELGVVDQYLIQRLAEVGIDAS